MVCRVPRVGINSSSQVTTVDVGYIAIVGCIAFELPTSFLQLLREFFQGGLYMQMTHACS